jgi:hypothetical protein
VTAVPDVVKTAIKQRVSGDRPSWLRTLVASVVIGVAVAVLAFKLLRSGSKRRAAGGAAE